MKIGQIITTACLAALVATGAQAQSSGSASANTNSSLTSNTDARTYIDGRTLIDQRGGDGDATLRTAPQVSAPSMSSGHPCAYTPASGGLSIIGAGISAGGQTVDDACLLAQMGDNASAMHMIAARNPAACRALVAQGRIPRGSYCGSGGSDAPSASTKNVRPTVVGVTCGRRSDGAIVVKIARNANVNRANAVAYCGG